MIDLKTRIIKGTATGSSSMFHPFIFNNFNEWKDKPLSFWLAILEEIKNKPLSLYLFLPFSYLYLGIDLINNYFSLKNISKESLEYVRDCLDEKYRWLYLYESDLRLITKINSSIFKEIIEVKTNLSKQGGKPVDEILISHKVPLKVNRDHFFLSQHLISK